MNAYRFTVPAMECGGCLKSITRMVQTSDPAAQVSGDPATKIADIRSGLDEAALRARLSEGGFPVA